MLRNFKVPFLTVDGKPVVSVDVNGRPELDESGQPRTVYVSEMIIRTLNQPKQGLGWSEQKSRNDLSERLHAAEDFDDYSKTDFDLIQVAVSDWGNPRLTGVVANIMEKDPQINEAQAPKSDGSATPTAQTGKKSPKAA
jgi:hypothetical protein